MRNLLILAVAASFAVACGASRTDDEVGAAPEGADTTAVIADTAQTYPTDTTMGQVETDTSYVQQDTTAVDPTMTTDSVGPQGEVQTGDTTGVDTWTDTTAAESGDTTAAGTADTTVDTTTTMHGDSALTEHAVPDTTTAQ